MMASFDLPGLEHSVSLETRARLLPVLVSVPIGSVGVSCIIARVVAPVPHPVLFAPIVGQADLRDFFHGQSDQLQVASSPVRDMHSETALCKLEIRS